MLTAFTAFVCVWFVAGIVYMHHVAGTPGDTCPLPPATASTHYTA